MRVLVLVLLVVCVCCVVKKRDVMSMAGHKKNDICKRTQITPLWIYLNYGLN